MKRIKRKRTWIILGGLALCVVIVIAGLLFVSQGREDDVKYTTVPAEMVTMKQTLTAAGKVMPGEGEKIQIEKGKKFKAALAESKEQVRAGQPLVYYMDGTHTDAPSDGIVTSIHPPKQGSKAGNSNYIGFRSTDDLYLSIQIPEDRINDMGNNEKAEIILSAQPEKRFKGKILRINGVSNAQIAARSENEGEDEDADEDEDEDEEEEEDDDAFSEDTGDDEEGEGAMAYYTVLVGFPNDGTVRPGMSATAVVTISERAKVLAVPVGAVEFDEDDQAFVTVMEKGKERKQVVELGESDPMNVEITGGLKKGTQVRVIDR